MNPRHLGLLGLLGMLAACSPSQSERAAAACNAEIGKRMNGRSFNVDLQDLAAHAREEATGSILLTSTVVLDKGLASEDRQSFECRVRFDAQGAPSVLFLQFNWNTSDLKRAG